MDPRVALLWLRDAATQPLASCNQHAEVRSPANLFQPPVPWPPTIRTAVFLQTSSHEKRLIQI